MSPTINSDISSTNWIAAPRCTIWGKVISLVPLPELQTLEFAFQ
jgi:hypothetical protein